MQPIFDFLEKFITDFNWKRVSLLIFLIVFIIISYFLYEQTFFSQISKIEKVTLILKDLENIKITEENKSIINDIYSKIEYILNSDKNLFDFLQKINLSVEFNNAILNSSPWILLLLIFIPRILKKKDDINALIGLCFFIFITGFIGYFLPNKNFLLYAIISNVLLFIILILFAKKKKK